MFSVFIQIITIGADVYVCVYTHINMYVYIDTYVMYIMYGDQFKIIKRDYRLSFLKDLFLMYLFNIDAYTKNCDFKLSIRFSKMSELFNLNTFYL